MTECDMRLFTVGDVAELCQASINSVYDMIDQGLPYIQCGRSRGYRIHPDDLWQWLDSRKMIREQPQSELPKARRRFKHVEL